MDGATLQAKLYRGYARAAQKAGLAFSQFRSTGTTNPLSGTPLATLNALFTPAHHGEFGTRHAGDHDVALWHTLIDGTQTAVGDYLAGNSATFFIAAQQPLLPILAVRCTHVVDVRRMAGASSAGVNPYGGDTRAGETAILTGFPGWLARGGIGGETQARLPGDIGERGFRILLPPVPVELYVSDIVVDAEGLRYVVAAVEKSDLGLRLWATQVVT
jgi:hypothetical protein